MPYCSPFKIHMDAELDILNRVDGDEIVICDEVTAPSADDLKKAKKVGVGYKSCLGEP